MWGRDAWIYCSHLIVIEGQPWGQKETQDGRTESILDIYAKLFNDALFMKQKKTGKLSENLNAVEEWQSEDAPKLILYKCNENTGNIFLN